MKSPCSRTLGFAVQIAFLINLKFPLDGLPDRQSTLLPIGFLGSQVVACLQDEGPIGLVLAPTRELAVQIEKEVLLNCRRVAHGIQNRSMLGVIEDTLLSLKVHTGAYLRAS